jgi:hypothetical protein
MSTHRETADLIKRLRTLQAAADHNAQMTDDLWEHLNPEKVFGEAADALTEAVAQEREACAQIAEAIDSNRGNEKQIASAIRARKP